MGEMEALRGLSGFDSTLPLVQVVDAKEGGARRLGGYLTKLPTGVSIALDGGPSRGEALVEIEEALRSKGESESDGEAWKISVVPVIRLGDGYAELDIFQRISEKYQSGYLLRLGSAEADPDIAEAESRIPLLLGTLGADSEEIDLVLDYAEIDSERTVDRISRSAQEAVQWAARRNWRSVTLLCGSFPSTISHLDFDQENILPRFEVQLWRNLALGESNGVDLHYGDYATNHPATQTGLAFRGPYPNLRYARDDAWIVYRRKATKDEGNNAFYDICQEVIDSPDWEGESFSWADRQIAAGARKREGWGNATKWVSLGMARHFEVVKHRLATLGAP